MRVSRAQAAANRRRIVTEASRLFRERGYDGVAVADLMKSAGLTHGGFYGHFESKEALMAETCASSGDIRTRWERLTAKRQQPPFQVLVEQYLSPRHRDQPGHGCLFAALSVDTARQTPEVRHAYTGTFRKFADMIADWLPGRRANRRRRALATASSLVGALVLSRAVDDPELSSEILDAVRQQLLGATASATSSSTTRASSEEPAKE